MKTRLPLFASLLLTLALATNAFALAGNLDTPGLAFPKDFPETVRTSMTDALTHTNCTFLGGRFVNSYTSLNYRGETVALNLFMEGLVKSPGTILSVRFQTASVPSDRDWMVTHDADAPHKLTVHINLKSFRINLEKLVIPESKGPALPESK
ncbi:MAG: hypothetical protein K0Q55_2059 [Verrucomicrobia bacterium]|jgi:hypothetical protein|nr:hypothetical protein [Verrucomicrobiota bacterium]